MADVNVLSEFSYVGKTPLLRGLKNPSGQFFLFSQYAEDLTKFLGNPNSNMPIPSSFYCLKVERPNPNTHDNETVTEEDPDAPIIIPDPTDDGIYIVYYGNNGNRNNVYWEYAPEGEEYDVKFDFDWTNEGYEFTGWTAIIDGVEQTFTETGEHAILVQSSPSSNISLYAQWDLPGRNAVEEEREEEELTRPNDDRWTSEEIRQWLFVNPAEEQENYPEPSSENTLIDAFDSMYCKELKYKGNINIFGRDKVDGINYNEIYCHIDNDAKRQKFELNLSDYRDNKYGKNYVIGYGPNPNDYQFTDYSDLIGEIFQNEYENGNTFFKLNNDAFEPNYQWNENYSLGRLLYVLYKNEMIHFTPLNTPGADHLWDDEPEITDYNGNNNVNESSSSTSNQHPGIISPNPTRSASTVEQAGVLSSKALFDSWYEGDGTEEDPSRGEYRFFKTTDMIVTDMPEKMKFDFNCIIVCYTHKNMTTGETDGTEIPMGIYFTGWDSTLDAGEGDFSNIFTKYVKNMEIYNQGTSYTLRICMRTIASQATEQGAERIVEILSASNTGEWVNEYEQLMCKFDETNNTLEQALNKYAQMNDNIETSLQLFRNNRTNVPYIATVNGSKYWFVNGTNTWAKVFEPTDYANWETNPIESGFEKVYITTLSDEYYTISPLGILQCYAGTRLVISINPYQLWCKVDKILYRTESMSEPYQYNVSDEQFDWGTNDEHYDIVNNITIKRELIAEDLEEPNYNYTFTILDVTQAATVSAEASY